MNLSTEIPSRPRAARSHAEPVRFQSMLTDHRCIGKLYLVAITVFAVIGVAAMAMARSVVSFPNGTETASFTQGQLLGLHYTLMKFFFLLPVIPAVVGHALLPAMVGAPRLAFPRIALTAFILFLLGGLLVLIAFLQGGIEPGWAYAVGSPMTRGTVSAGYLAGLFLACLSLQLTGLNLIVTLRQSKQRPLPLLAKSLFWAGCLMQVALPLVASAIAIGLMEKLLPFGVLDAAMDAMPTLLPWFLGVASTPMKFIILLPALGVACALFPVERGTSRAGVRHMGWYIAAMAVLSVLAVDLRVMPGDVSSLFSLLGAFYKILVLLPLFALIVHILVAAAHRWEGWTGARLYAAGMLALVLVFLPLDLFLSLGISSVFSGSYLATAHFHFMIAAAGLLAFLGAMHQWWPELGGNPVRDTWAKPIAVVILVGFAATFLPMIVLGQHGFSPGSAVYPPSYQPLHVLASAGGSILSAGLLGSLFLLVSAQWPRSTAMT